MQSEPDAIAQYNADLLAYQNKAMRTLGLAYKYIPEASERIVLN